MSGYRHRYMLNVTGLPGWVRFGFSPGWQRVSPKGFPPAGQLPQFTSRAAGGAKRTGNRRAGKPGKCPGRAAEKYKEKA